MPVIKHYYKTYHFANGYTVFFYCLFIFTKFFFGILGVRNNAHCVQSLRNTQVQNMNKQRTFTEIAANRK